MKAEITSAKKSLPPHLPPGLPFFEQPLSILYSRGLRFFVVVLFWVGLNVFSDLPVI